MRLALFVLFFVSSSLAWWEMDATTGWVWDSTRSQPGYCSNTSPLNPVGGAPETCCAQKRTDVSKLQVALPDSVEKSQTFMTAGTERSLCPAFQGDWYAYDANGSFKEIIGTAVIRWGGDKGICLQVTVDIQNICWTQWHARVGATSIASISNSFPPFEPADTSVWMSAYTGAACTRGSFSFQLCPTDPPAIPDGTGTASSEWPLMGCYQSAFISMHLALATVGYTDAWLVPHQETVPITTTSVCPLMQKAPPLAPCTSSFTSFACRKCINGTNCCAEPRNPLYGICASSAADNCPGLGDSACSSGNCPGEVTCITLLEVCPPSTRCFGKTSCDPLKGCPAGYQKDQFCYWNGASGGVKICCTIGVDYNDGTATSSPTCQGFCYQQSYAAQCKTGSTVVNCGTVKTYISGTYFYVEYSFLPTSNFSISNVKLYLGNNAASASGWTFSYPYNAANDFPETPFSPYPIFKSTSFVVKYDLLRPIGSSTGFLIPCNSTFQFNFQATVISGGVTYTAALPSSTTTSWGTSVVLTPVSNDFAYWTTVTRCCKGDISTTTGCAEYPCTNTLKFIDQLRWDQRGIEFETSRCCAMDQVLDFVLPSLPEGVNNAASSVLSLASDVGATCVDGSCSMALTYVYEGSSTRNNLGYYFYDPSTAALDTTTFRNGLCTVFPDVSALHSQGCMNQGDTFTISVPAGKSVGWFVRKDGFSWTDKAGSTDNSNVFYSRVGSALVNPDASTSHFGWLPFANSFIFGLEDSSVSVGDKDYNDAIFAVKLNGAWTTGSSLNTGADTCAQASLTCLTFEPYHYAQFIYTPGCIPYITLDPAVGYTTGKDCLGYYILPSGWEIAPADDLSIQAALTYATDWWKTSCAIMRNVTTGELVGYNAYGPCSGFTVETISDGINTCYAVTSCTGQLLIRRTNYLVPSCNANNYGEYCNPNSTGVFYRSTVSNAVSDMYVSLVPNKPLTVSVFVPMYNRVQVFVLIDSYNLAGGTGKNEEAACLGMTTSQIPGILGTGFIARAVGYGYTNPPGSASAYNVPCPMTFDSTVLSDFTKCVPPQLGANYNTNSNILEALTSVLQANPNIFGWLTLHSRIIWVPTKAQFTVPTSYYNGVVVPFRNALINSGINVVFVPTTTTARSYLVNTVCSGIGRCSVADIMISWPNFDVNASPTPLAKAISVQAAYWEPMAYRASTNLFGRFEFVRTNDIPQFSSEIPPYAIPEFGNTTYPDYQVYRVDPGATLTLPSGYPGPNTASQLPHIIVWKVPPLLGPSGAQYLFNMYISWNEPPTLTASTISYQFNDAATVPLIVKFVDSVTSAVDPNYNKLDVLLLSSTFSPSSPTSGWVASAVGYLGAGNGVTVAMPVKLNQRFNIVGLAITPLPNSYGTWTLTYQLFDGCLLSPVGTMIINYYPTKVDPVCTSITQGINAGQPWLLDWTNPPRITSTNLGSCSPLPTPTTTVGCASGCSTCYPNTDCCASGSATCRNLQTTPQCPNGGSYLCSGATCPTLNLDCVPLAGACAVNTTCVGYTQCKGSGCPVTFQDGMFCVYTAPPIGITKSFSVCCSQLRSNLMSVSINDNRSTTFGTINYYAGTTLTAITSWGVPSAQYTPTLQFVPRTGYSGKTTWSYSAYAPITNRFVTCTITVNINNPPVVYVNGVTSPTTVSTPVSTVGTWTVRITDLDVNDTEKLYMSGLSGIKFSLISSTTWIQNPGSYLPNPTLSSMATTTGDVVLLSNLVLNPTTGDISFTMYWTPSASYPYNQPSTFFLYAVDSTGAKSNVVQVTLTVPNQPPIFEGISPSAIDQRSPPININVQGSDPNLADTTVLSLTITSLPTKGTLTFRGQAVQLNRAYTFLDAAQSMTQVTGKTNFGFVYTPYSTSYGSDFFDGFFTDPLGLTGSGRINISINRIPLPPTTIDVSATTTQNNPVTLTVPAYSTDGYLVALVIDSINFGYPSLATLTYKGQVVKVGDILTVPQTTSANFVFTYVTSQYQTISDTFTYHALDNQFTPGLTSVVHTGTISGTATPQAPVVGSKTVSGIENQPVYIPLPWGPISATNMYYDIDSSQSVVLIKILSLPSEGTLIDVNGTAISVGTILPSNSVTYQPKINSVTTTSFTFQAIDNTQLTSNVGTITITLTPTVTPPVLQLTPSLLTLARGTTGDFTATVYDNDSDQIKVYLTNASAAYFPYSCAVWNDAGTSVPCSTLTVKPPAGSGATTTYSSTNVPSGTVLVATINNAGNWGKVWTITLTWAPSTQYYSDATTGTFQMYAQDNTAPAPLSSATRTGTVAIIANTPPTVYNPSQYSLTWDEDAKNTYVVSLQGTDAQSYHNPYLRFDILSLPTGGPTLTRTLSGSTSTITSVVSIFGYATSASNSLSTTGARSTAFGTEAFVTLNIPVNWYGTTSFTFQVVDLLGAKSEIQTVTLTVNPINDAPVTQDVNIVVYQYRCIFTSCGNVQASDLIYTSSPITAVDVDTSTLSLSFASLPTTSQGVLTLGAAPTSSLASTGPFSTSAKSWLVDFQPAPTYKNCFVSSPVGTQWQTCTPLVIPFTISDGVAVPVAANLNLYVVFVNTPPVSTDVTKVALLDDPTPVPIPATDVDSNMMQMVIIKVVLNAVPAGQTATTVTGPTGTAPLTSCDDTTATACNWSYNFAQTGSTTVTFVYTGSWTTENTDYFLYYFVDASGGKSPVYQASILQAFNLIPPEAAGETLVIDQNTFGTTIFDFGVLSTVGETYNRYSAQVSVTDAQTFIKITSLPLNGVLTYNGAAVTVGQVLPATSGNPVVTYTPYHNFHGTDSYTFQAYDNIYKLFSNDATIDIVVNHVNQPPELTIVPSLVIVDRTVTAVLTVQAFDIDSSTIAVYFDANSAVTAEFISLLNSDLIVYDPLGALYTTFSSSNLVSSLPSGLLLTLDNSVNQGAVKTFIFTWTPPATYPYNVLNYGEINLYAQDTEGLTSSTSTGRAEVTDNNPPVTRGTYSYTVPQATPSLNITLEGTDPDAWHDKVLDVQIVNLPPTGVTITGVTTSGTSLSAYPATIGTGTAADITVNIDPTFWGTATFTYTVTDLAGAVSAPKTVTIFVDPTPPLVDPITIVLPENTCMFPPCSTGVTPGNATELPCTTQTTSGSATIGEVSTGVVGVTDDNVADALTTTPGNCSYYIWYQPPPQEYSTGCPVEAAGNMSSCEAFTTFPVTVCDHNTGKCTTTTVTIIVTPVYVPPITYDTFASTRTAVLSPVGVVGEDGDNITKIQIVSVNLMDNTTTTLTYNGENVYPGMIIDNPGTAQWNFDYVNTNRAATVDTFTYLVWNNHVQESNVATGNITLPVIYLPPTVIGASLTTPEQTELLIVWQYSETGMPSTNPTYYNIDGTSTSAVVTIESLPTLGTLYTTTGEAVIPGTTVPLNELVYLPNAGVDSQTDSFTFKAVDAITGTSNIATVEIYVSHINRPPVIQMTPDGVIMDRTSEGVFTVTVSDIDSASIDVIITGIFVPFASADGTVDWSSLVVYDNMKNVVQDYSYTVSPIDQSVIITLNYPDAMSFGSNMTFTIGWTPSAVIPDGTTGSFMLFASDGTASSNLVTGTLAVTPNRPPVVIDNPSGPSYYSFTVGLGTWTSDTLTLAGTDIDTWHSEKLRFELLNVPEGEILVCLATDTACATPISNSALPTFLGTPGTGNTFGSLVIMPVGEWFGETTLTFRVIDPLGAVSDPQIIVITIFNTQRPPSSNNLILVVYEDSCVFPECLAVDSSFLLERFVQVFGSDPNELDLSSLTLTWDTVPDPTVTGTLGYVATAGDQFLSVLPAATTLALDPNNPWKVWFQPLANQSSTGCIGDLGTGCSLYASATFHITDRKDNVSPTYDLSIYVLPVNDPPSSRDLIFHIPMDTELIVYYDDEGGMTVTQIPATDIDNTNDEVGAHSLGVSSTSVGTWYTSDDVVVARTGKVLLPGRYLRYVPPAHAYSIPNTVPLTTLYFEVFDLEPLTSRSYSIQVYVDFVPQPVDWVGPKSIRTLEETPVNIKLNDPEFYATVDAYGIPVFTLLTGPTNNKGYFYTCADGVCTNITNTSVPMLLPPNGFYYQPPPDSWTESNCGDGFTTFFFKLEILTPDGKVSPISTTTLEFTINVTCVNDPPILFPIGPLAIISGSGIFDENTTTFDDSTTFYRFQFGGMDVDNKKIELRAQILTLTDHQQATIFVCTPANLPGGRGRADCTDGQPLETLDFVQPIDPENAIWELSIQGSPHWFGLLKFNFVVWDPSLNSKPGAFRFTIRPINDYPSIVEGTTTAMVEYYEVIEGVFQQVISNIQETASFTISDTLAQAKKDLGGAVVLGETQQGTQQVTPPAATGPVFTVFRLRTQIQDIDFNFGRSLNFTGSLISASWANFTDATAKRAESPCSFGPFYVNCFSEIGAINTFLTTYGFPLLLDDGATSAVGLFLIDDMGNIDWQGRPLATGFTIEFSTPSSSLSTPIAAIVILPIIAVATVAAIGAAWMLLGHRAREYAAASFDAFVVEPATEATVSPLYDDQGRDVISPIYVGK